MAKSTFIDLAGQEFGRIKVIGRNYGHHYSTTWFTCQCKDCGYVFDAASKKLRKGLIFCKRCQRIAMKGKKKINKAALERRKMVETARMISVRYGCLECADKKECRYLQTGIGKCNYEEELKDYFVYDDYDRDVESGLRKMLDMIY